MEGMNKFRIQYIYTCKCHNETLCIGILNKKMSFFKNKGQRGKTVPVWGMVQWEGEDIRTKGHGRLNMV
jgi:hypothetical protein